MKTLYFEGAGSVPSGEVENCRIRTAFRNDKGEVIYLELCGFEASSSQKKIWPTVTYIGAILACYRFQDGKEGKYKMDSIRNYKFEYTKAQILKLVNSLGCNFDRVVILPDLAGYRVFKGDGSGEYNFGDEFEYNEERTARAEEIKRYFYELEKSEGKNHPNFSLWVDQENLEMLHLLRHFPGYNKHWLIKNVPNWKETVTETKLGMYAC